MTSVCALDEKESIISCLNIDKFMTVDRLGRKPCCSSIRVILNIGNNFELIIFVNNLGIIDILELAGNS